MRIDAGRMTAMSVATMLAAAVAMGSAGPASAQSSASTGGDPAWKAELEAMVQRDHGCKVTKTTFASFTSGGQEMVFATIDCEGSARPISATRVGKQAWSIKK